MKNNKQNRGITLIALIITVIVMIILVAVSVSVALQGGLFDKAKTAADDTKEAVERESLQDFILGEMDVVNGIIPGTFTKNYTDSDGKTWTVTAAESGDDIEITLTNGTDTKTYLLGENLGIKDAKILGEEEINKEWVFGDDFLGYMGTSTTLDLSEVNYVTAYEYLGTDEDTEEPIFSEVGTKTYLSDITRINLSSSVKDLIIKGSVISNIRIISDDIETITVVSAPGDEDITIPQMCFCDCCHDCTINLPANISSIGESAFSNYVKKIVFAGKQSQWDGVSKDLGWKVSEIQVECTGT